MVDWWQFHHHHCKCLGVGKGVRWWNKQVCVKGGGIWTRQYLWLSGEGRRGECVALGSWFLAPPLPPAHYHLSCTLLTIKQAQENVRVWFSAQRARDDTSPASLPRKKGVINSLDVCLCVSGSSRRLLLLLLPARRTRRLNHLFIYHILFLFPSGRHWPLPVNVSLQCSLVILYCVLIRLIHVNDYLVDSKAMFIIIPSL